VSWILVTALGVYVNVMDQYRPAYKTDRYPEIHRRTTDDEYRYALEIAREEGIVRLDGPCPFHKPEGPWPSRSRIFATAPRNHETTVHIRQPRSFHRALADGELLAQSEIFQTKRASRFES